MPQTITHIFFDLHGTLVDGDALHPCYSRAMGRILSARYGGDPGAWAQANSRILADWDSYYADLDLDGDEGLADYREGLFRTTRAMFRLMAIPEPAKDELMALAWELPGKVTQGCDAIFPDVPPVIASLHAAGYTLGVTSHALVAQGRGLLQGGGLLDYFTGPFVGPDNAEQFRKDAAFFRLAPLLADVDPAQCVVVDDTTRYIPAIKATGMYALHLRRHDRAFSPHADAHLHGDLSALMAVIARF